ncbi:MAG: DEAD/DEAH box helicase [Planctomycetota bacterium]
MTYELRPYQAAAVERAVAYLTDPRKKGRNGIVVVPTGGGKSLVLAGIVKGLGGPCIVLQPSKEILEQNAQKLVGYGYKPAIFSASTGRHEIGDLTLGTIGTVANQATAFRAFPYVLIDECHHLVNPRGGMYARFLAAIDGARICGTTATPYRLHSNSFGSILRFLTRTRPRIFHDVIFAAQVGDLLRAGYLAPVEYRQRAVIRRERLRLNSTGADYTDQSVQQHFREVGFAGRLQVEVVRLLVEGRRNIVVFTRFVEESEQLARAIPGAAVVTAETPARERERILEDFRAGRIRVVSNVGIIALGFDFPALETVVLARPTLSLAVFYQQIGRAIRPHPDKARAVVLDLVGLVQQFGRVEDLVLRPGGKTGEQWVVTSNGRPLTNCYFGEQDSRRKYWAERNSAARCHVADAGKVM